MNYISVTPKNTGQIKELLVDSFKHYPTFAAPFSKRANPTQAVEKFLSRFFSVEVSLYLKKGLVVAVMDGTSLVGVYVLKPPFTKLTLIDYLLAGGLKLLPYLANKDLLKANSAAALSATDFWEIEYLAITPQYQGQGLGGSIIEESIVPTVRKHHDKKLILVTHTKRNVKFYQKHDFEVSNEIYTDTKNAEITNTIMTRVV
ncbi:GNAT family N-acetyltransferase [Pediococcus siamensis]|uniref:GNAT family N-acetyltransferase n=1 Tax=Pediococcus siamensis TaxID=381829 RepID=UPI0039A2E999